MRWPAILLVVLTTLTLAVATGRGCSDSSIRSEGATTAGTDAAAGEP